jgi:malonyl-CoA O-methyltransferase
VNLKIMDKKTIVKNFSRYASLYDRYSHIQSLAAVRLLGVTKNTNVKKALEIGCGSGNYTALLKERLGGAELKAVDISGKMIEVARGKVKDKNVEFIVADGETIDLHGFDLITSNACFQWFEDLERALIKYKSMLNKDGALSFSLFGTDTLVELHSTLKAVLLNTATVTDAFLGKQRLEEILARNFKEFNIEEEKFEELFSDLKELLNRIKYTGIRGEGIKEKKFFGPGLLKKIEEAYVDRFSVASPAGRRIRATYQVFFCWGLK